MLEKEEARGERKPLYQIARALAFVVFHTIAPVVYHDADRLNGEGACLIISNHRHALDPAVIALPVKRRVTFLAKKELASTPLTQKLMRGLGVIPVDRHNRDMQAMRECGKVLKEGGILGVFPEGTRHHEGDMEQIETGAALLALRYHPALIPVWMPETLRFFHVNHCWVGEDIPLEDLTARGVNTESCEALQDRIRATYRDIIAKNRAKNS